MDKDSRRRRTANSVAGGVVDLCLMRRFSITYGKKKKEQWQ